MLGFLNLLESRMLRVICLNSYLLDVLALELGDELVETLRLGVDANGLKDGLDVRGSRGLVAAELEEEVGCEVLHFDC